MRLAITGATGFVGRSVVRECLRRGHEVVALVRNPKDARLPAHPKSTARAWDLLRARDSEELLEQVDAILHLAAYVPSRMDDPDLAEQCFEQNAFAVRDLIDSAARAGVKRFVFASTGSLYVNQGRPSRENDPVYPAMHAPYYLASKLAGEVFAAHTAQHNGIALTIVRIGSVYGPGMRADSVVSRFLTQAAARVPHQIQRGAHTADFVFVDDVAAVFAAVVERRAAGFFNAGSGVAMSIDQLSRATQAVAAGQVLMDDGEPATSTAEPSGFPALDVSRARSELGFLPTELHDGLCVMLAAHV